MWISQIGIQDFVQPFLLQIAGSRSQDPSMQSLQNWERQPVPENKPKSIETFLDGGLIYFDMKTRNIEWRKPEL